MHAENFLKPLGDFSARDYLRFLASKASPSWLTELTSDGGVELDLDPVLDVSHLLEPLKTLAFPTDYIEDLDTLLVSVVIGYSSEEEATNVFKVIYASSLYLYCHAMTEKTTTGVVDLACALIAQRVVQMPSEEKLQIVKFLFWICEKEEAKGHYHLDYPKASLLLCAHIISPNPSEALLEAANSMFRAEFAAVGPSPDSNTIKAALEEAERTVDIQPRLDAKRVLEQIGDASPCHETSIKIFRSALQGANLDVTKVEMLNPTH